MLQLADVEDSVGLERKSPLWVGEHRLYTRLDIGVAHFLVFHKTWLEKTVFGFDVAIHIQFLIQIHHFQLMTLGEYAGVRIGSLMPSRRPIKTAPRWASVICLIR